VIYELLIPELILRREPEPFLRGSERQGRERCGSAEAAPEGCIGPVSECDMSSDHTILMYRSQYSPYAVDGATRIPQHVYAITPAKYWDLV
jgi:hypothetical protein